VSERAPGTRVVEHVMGMPILVDVRDDVEPALVEAVFDWLRRVDSLFSTYRADSEISRIARGELAAADACVDVQAVLVRCDRLREQTDGYFDAYAAGSLDPSGLVKGWAVDRGASLLQAAGITNYAINAGGDIRLHGRAIPEPAWRVGIQHPHEPDRVAAVVESSNLAVATSGAYARGDHVLDPHTRRPPQGILSVTVTGPDLATADAYATAAFAMGAPRACRWTRRLEHPYEAMTILTDGRVLSTRRFPVAAELS
jgi:thiamine biosynthesis lipoprotein